MGRGIESGALGGSRGTGRLWERVLNQLVLQDGTEGTGRRWEVVSNQTTLMRDRSTGQGQ